MMVMVLMVMIMMMMTKIKDSGLMIAGWAHSSSAAAVKSLIFLSSSPPCVIFVFCILLYVFCVLYFVLRSVFCIQGYLCFVTCMARFCTFCIVKRTFDSTTLPFRGAVIYTGGR